MKKKIWQMNNDKKGGTDGTLRKNMVKKIWMKMR